MQRIYGQMYKELESCQNDLVLCPPEDNEWVLSTTDGRVKFIGKDSEVFAEVRAPRHLPVLYPVRSTPFQRPAKAVLMDLDGTTILSEEFWVDAIQDTVRLLLRNKAFVFSPEDLPHVAGYSTREHLQYCLKQYEIEATLDHAVQMNEAVIEERLKQVEEDPSSPLLKPSPGLKEFLLTLKERGVKIALVTSAAERKALIEIRSVFMQLKLGDPLEFYDTIFTAGSSGSSYKVSTLGSLASKPHPWLYAEAASIGLGLSDEEREHVIGIEDSAAGVLALKLAGFAAVGMTGGNIESSGVRPLLHAECTFLPALLPLLLE